MDVSAGLVAAGGTPAPPTLVWLGPLPGARPLSSMMLPMVRPDEGPDPGCECLPMPRGGWWRRADALMESIRADAVEDCVESAAAGGTPAAPPCPRDEAVCPEVACGCQCLSSAFIWSWILTAGALVGTSEAMVGKVVTVVDWKVLSQVD